MLSVAWLESYPLRYRKSPLSHRAARIVPEPPAGCLDGAREGVCRGLTTLAKTAVDQGVRRVAHRNTPVAVRSGVQPSDRLSGGQPERVAEPQIERSRKKVKSNRVGIYVRVSKRRGDMMTLQNQMREAEELCSRNGWTVVFRWVENGKSAYKKSVKRP